MYNEELIIFISLVTAFVLIFNLLKKSILNAYYENIDSIYYHYYILLHLNKWINLNFIKHINFFTFQYKNVNLNFFLSLIKQLIKDNIIKPNLERFFININKIYTNFLMLQNLNYKNLYLFIANKHKIKKQYILLYGIIRSLNKKLN